MILRALEVERVPEALTKRKALKIEMVRVLLLMLRWRLMVGPQQRALNFLQAEDWYKMCCSDVRTATEVELAICMYDNLQVYEELVKKLKSRGQFKLNFYKH